MIENAFCAGEVMNKDNLHCL